MAESQWHLEVNGKKVGPFTLDQIQGLYDDGEIRGYHQVTSDQLGGKWISVQELIDSAAINAPAPPPDFTGETPQLKPPVSEFIPQETTLEAVDDLEVSVLETPTLEALTLEAPVLETVGETETFEATQAISLPDLVEAGEQIPSSEPALYNAKGAAPKASSPTTQTSPNLFLNSSPNPFPGSFPNAFKEPPQEFNADFQPPPRPADLNTSTSAHTSVPPSAQDAQPVTTVSELPAALPSLESGASEPVVATTAYTPTAPDSNARVAADPALSLLSSLQNLRERQTSQIQHDPTIILHSDSISGSLRKPIPMRMWVTAIFAGIILGALSIGLIKIFKHKPVMGAPGSLTEINQSKPQIQEQPSSALGQSHPPVVPPPAQIGNGGRPQNFARHNDIRPPKPAPLPPQGATAVPANSSIREREPEPSRDQNNQNNPAEQNPNGYPPGQPPQQNPIQPPMDLNNPPLPGYPPGYPPQPGQPGQPMMPQPMDPNLGNGNGYPPPPAAPGYPPNQGNPGVDPNQGGGYPPPQGNGEQPQGYPPQGNGEQAQPQPGNPPGQDQFQQQPPAQPNIQQ